MALAAIEDAERIEELIADGRALSAAYRTNFAMADGKRLEAEHRAWVARLAADPNADGAGRDGGITDEERAHVERILSAMFGKRPAATDTEAH